MSATAATIHVNVDVANPGHFFACCGLLELADRMWPGGAEGWFDGGNFHITSGGSLVDALRVLGACRAEEVLLLDNGLTVKPLIAPLRLSFTAQQNFTFTLDAWLTIRVEKGQAVAVANPPWNFWSGQQTSKRIWTALHAAFVTQFPKLDSRGLQDLFAQRVQLSGRFGFDPGAAWNALDAGFSPNEQKMQVGSSAAVELLAAVGLQRFRPRVADNRASFVYSIWGQPLAPLIAAAAAAGSLAVRDGDRYRARVLSRGSYAALGYATCIRGEEYE